jgi:hypothetical protein
MSKINKIIDISAITSKKLSEGEYEKVLPEYYLLKSVRENSIWHDNQAVFDHVVAVFAHLEQILKLDFLNKNSAQKIQRYLAKTVGKKTRRDLLIVSALLHDIAKTDTVITDKSGKADAPGHEMIGGILVRNFSSRFGLDKKDECYVEKIVHYHGFISDISTLIIAKGNFAKYFGLLKQTVGDIYIELALLKYADNLGSDLAKFDPKGAQKRLAILKKFLNE